MIFRLFCTLIYNSKTKIYGGKIYEGWSICQFHGELHALTPPFVTIEFHVPGYWLMFRLFRKLLQSIFNKDLRSISLTSTLSKIAENFIIDRKLKPVVLRSVDPSQFGFIPGSSTTFSSVFLLVMTCMASAIYRTIYTFWLSWPRFHLYRVVAMSSSSSQFFLSLCISVILAIRSVSSVCVSIVYFAFSSFLDLSFLGTICSTACLLTQVNIDGSCQPLHSLAYFCLSTVCNLFSR